MVKGIAYSLVWDIPRFRSEFDAVFKVSPDDPYLLESFAISLSRLGFDSEAREIYSRIIKLVINAPVVLVDYGSKCIATNRPDLFKEIFEVYERGGGELTVEVEEIARDVLHCQARLDAVGLPNSVAEQLYAQVGEICRKFRVKDIGGNVWLNNEDGVEYLAGFVGVEVDARLLSQMNEALTDSVLASIDFDQSEKFVYQFVPEVSVDHGSKKSSEAV